ncbi:hypothetical protein [Sphingomonas sp. Leaf17]|uniref:hypothetical protein n=1 Tax=Sphingomonas sp. Leaf17 TaxID=1735683 RepID=UPI0012E3228D|nr:hypothetical protein [Sphingomonas sp. Leaf17]
MSPKSQMQAGFGFVVACVLIGTALSAVTNHNRQREAAAAVQSVSEAKAKAMEAEADRLDAQADELERMSNTSVDNSRADQSETEKSPNSANIADLDIQESVRPTAQQEAKYNALPLIQKACWIPHVIGTADQEPCDGQSSEDDVVAADQLYDPARYLK